MTTVADKVLARTQVFELSGVTGDADENSVVIIVVVVVVVGDGGGRVLDSVVAFVSGANVAAGVDLAASICAR